MTTEAQWLGLRAALVIGLAASITRLICLTLGLGDIPAAFGVVVGVLVVRPDFCRWPALIYPVLMVIAAVAMGVGLSVRMMFPDAPQVWWFGIVGVVMQLMAVALPASTWARPTSPCAASPIWETDGSASTTARRLLPTTCTGSADCSASAGGASATSRSRSHPTSAPGRRTT